MEDYFGKDGRERFSEIGDVGILSEKNCLCGRGLPLLEKVVGRIRSRLKNKFGDYINTGFYSLFYFKENIARRRDILR